jgi:DNA-binding IclR family transcriptional regulator
METTLGRGNISSETVFQMLRVLSRTDRPIGAADIHRITGEPTSSVHRAIATLEEAQFVARDQGSSRFVPGRMCSHLVRALINRYAVRHVAQPYLMRLVHLADGPVTINARLGWYSIRLASLDGRAEYHEARRVGEARLLHLDAAPLAILSFLPDGERGAYLRFALARTGQSGATLALDALIAQVRHGDHVRRPDPARSDRLWIGYPLRNTQGKVVASVAVSMPAPASAKGPEAELQREIAATVAALQRDMDSDPAQSAAPFETLDPDTILIDTD